MKLGVAYIAFDGTELLEHSIRQIRNNVDYICVLYQKRSWFGHPISKEDLQNLELLKKSNLIDDLIDFDRFIPVRGANTKNIKKVKHYELQKRQFGLNVCLNKGCTHYLCMDVDEFYESSEFKRAKREIEINDYDITAVKFINYVNLPTIHRGFDSSHVPFICKINPAAKMTSNFFVRVDPTRGIKNGGKKSHQFNKSEIKMHHMETVRKNLTVKYASTTRAIFQRNRTSELVSRIKSVNEQSTNFTFNKIIFPKSGKMKLTQCQNIFNIPYQTWQE
jgi:hypothetical protein